MKLLIDLHYSDFWADPATQIIPKAWQADKDNPDKMAQHVYDYTKYVIEQFQKTGIEVGMVQVGNEITKGMLDTWTDYGKNVENSKLVNKYLAKGCKAVRDVAPNALIALHLESQNVDQYRTIMNGWKRDHVDYDVLGTSNYAYWGNTVDSLEGVLKLGKEYGKFVTVLETGWLNSTEDADGTPNNISANNVGNAYQVGVQGQVDMLTQLYQTLSKYDNGLGAFYWEPAWIPVKAGWINWKYNKDMADKYGTGWASKGAEGYYPDYKLYYNGNPCWGGTSWDNQTLFDMNGHALQSLKFYKESITTKQPAISINSATVSNIKNKTYTGKEQTQDIVVRINGKTLKKDKDYTVKYSNNKAVGTATITITGKGNYSGTIKKTFKISIKNSSTYTIDTMKYKVTNARTDGKGTVELVSIPSNSKKTTITVPSTVKISGKTFRVSSIGSKAFKNKTHVKKIVLGKYITKIGQESFYGCKSLNTIEIKTTNLKSVGKNSIAKIHKKAYIKVPSSKVITYKKLFNKSTGWQNGYVLKRY